MKRSGFTMIELIFVIVILGILAAVALPKFIGVSEQAQVGKLKGYVGTLNRTVAPAIWSQSISNGTSGAVSALSADVAASLDVLEGILDNGGNMPAIDLTACTAANTVIGSIGSAKPAGGTVSTLATVGGTTYNIGCAEGDMTHAPSFWLDDNTNIVVK